MGYDVRTVNKHDTTALDMAIRNDRTDLVEILIRHGADVNRRDRSGRTTLFAARSVAVATILINAGAIVEICDNRGSSCVKHHLSDGRDDIADLLVSYGARVQPSSKREVSQEDVKNDGVGVLRRFFTKEHPKSLSDFELMATIDFGFVLPIGSVPLPGV